MKSQSDMLRKVAEFLVQVNPDSFTDSSNDVSSMPNLRHAVTMAHWALEQEKPGLEQTGPTNWKDRITDTIIDLRRPVADRLFDKVRVRYPVDEFSDWIIKPCSDEWVRDLHVMEDGGNTQRKTRMTIRFPMGQSMIVDARFDDREIPQDMYNNHARLEKDRINASADLLAAIEHEQPWRDFGYDYTITSDVIQGWTQVQTDRDIYTRDFIVEMDAGEKYILAMTTRFDMDGSEIIHATFGSLDITSLAIAVANGDVKPVPDKDSEAFDNAPAP